MKRILIGALLAALFGASVAIARLDMGTDLDIDATPPGAGGGGTSYHYLLIDGSSHYLLIDGASHKMRIDGAQ